MTTSAFPPSYVLYVFGVCLLAGIVRLLTRWMVVHHTVVMFLIGTLFGYLSHEYPTFHRYVNLEFLTSARLLQVHTLLLPTIILEYLFSMDPRVFLSCSPIAVIAAILDYVLTLLTQGTFVFFFLHFYDIPSAPIKYMLIYLLVGSLTSVTDTSYVVNTFYKMGSYWVLLKLMEIKRVISLVGACVVYIFVVYASEFSYDIGWYEVLVFVLLQIFACPALGWLAAQIVIFWVGRLYNDLGVEVTVSVAVAYLLYYFGTVNIAEKPMVSAITVVVYALLLNNRRTCFSLGLDVMLHKLVRIMAYVVKTTIFTISGFLITYEDYDLSSLETANANMLVFSNVLVSFTLYAWCTLGRGLVCLLVSPMLRRCGYKLSWQELSTMVFCNVTGTVCLITAVASCNRALVELFYNDRHIQVMVMFHLGILALIRSLVAGTLFRHVLMVLGMRHVSLGRYVAMNNALQKVQEQIKTSARSYTFDRFLADADWETVHQFTNFDEPYKDISRYSVIERAMHLDPELLGDVRLNLMHAQKMSFWRQYEQGLLSLRALRILLEECYLAEWGVTTSGYDIGEQIKVHYEIKVKGMFRVIQMLKLKFEEMQEVRRAIIEEIRRDVKGRLKTFLFKIGLHLGMEVILIIAVIISATISIAILIHEIRCSENWHTLLSQAFLYYMNYAFMMFYSVYILLKLYIFKFRYMALFGSFVNIMLFIIGWIDIGLHGIVVMDVEQVCAELISTNWALTTNIAMHKSLLVCRCFRLFILLEDKTYIIVHTVKKRMLLQLQLGYDVGKSYVYCKEDVNQTAAEFIINDSKLDLIQKELQTSRVQLMRDLATVQKKYPGIVVSVKSQEACRRLLNVAKETVNQLQRNGRIDAYEADMLDEMIKMRLKKLNNIPAQIEIPSVDVLISKLPWVNGDENLMRFLHFNSKLFNMAEGESVDFDTDPTAGLYILISGLIRVNWTIGDPYGKLLQPSHASSETSIHTYNKMILHDYMTTGSAFGELALLTENPIVIDAVCETTVLMYQVKYESIRTALDWITEPSLEYRLWQLAAVRLSIPLLKALPIHHNSSLEDLKVLTDHGMLTVKRLESHLQDGTSEETFNLGRHSFSHVVLIHGTAKKGGETYVGPIIIPPDNDDIVFSSVYCDVYVLYVIPYRTLASVGFIYSLSTSDMSTAPEASKDTSAPIAGIVSRMMGKKRGRRVSVAAGTALRDYHRARVASSQTRFFSETDTIVETESATDSRQDELGMLSKSGGFTGTGTTVTPFSTRFSIPESSTLYEQLTPPSQAGEQSESRSPRETSRQTETKDGLPEVEPVVPPQRRSSEPRIPYSEAWKYVNPEVKLTLNPTPRRLSPTARAPPPPTANRNNNQNANASSNSNSSAQRSERRTVENETAAAVPNQADVSSQVVLQIDENRNESAATEDTYHKSLMANEVSFRRSEQMTTTYGPCGDGTSDDGHNVKDAEENQLDDIGASSSLSGYFDDDDTENVNSIDRTVDKATTPPTPTSTVDLQCRSPTTESSSATRNDFNEDNEVVRILEKDQTVYYRRCCLRNVTDENVATEPEPADMASIANEATDRIPGPDTADSGLVSIQPETGHFSVASSYSDPAASEISDVAAAQPSSKTAATRAEATKLTTESPEDNRVAKNTTFSGTAPHDDTQTKNN